MSLALVFISCSFLIIVGVIAIIYGLSHSKHSYSQTKDLIVKKTGKVMRHDGPKLPETFDPDFIEDEAYKFRHSTNIVEAYFDALFFRFQTKQQRKVLEKLIKYNDTVARGIASQAEIMRQKTELEEAKTTCIIAQDEELRKQKHKTAKLGEEAKQAELLAQIREADQRGRPKEPEPKAPEKKKKTPEEYIAKLEKILNIKIGDLTRLDQVVGEKLNELFETEIKEKAEVDRLKLPEAEKERRKGAINSRYTKLRDEVNRLAYQIKIRMKKEREF